MIADASSADAGRIAFLGDECTTSGFGVAKIICTIVFVIAFECFDASGGGIAGVSGAVVALSTVDVSIVAEAIEAASHQAFVGVVAGDVL